ncbi:MAG: hypothetical protein WD070_01830 [Pirellulaceae bacterium]
MPKKKEIKVGIREGGGPHPGYRRSAFILDLAFSESKFLSSAQYQHLALQLKELAQHGDPTHSDIIDVKKIKNESFYERRDKGGVLGSLNVRVFFGVDDDERAIVILGVIKKQNNGPTPQGDIIRMRRRWRKYKKGDYGTPYSG